MRRGPYQGPRFFVGVSRPALEEFYNPENEGIYSTFLAMGHIAAPFVVLSAGLAVIKVEVTGMTGDSVLGCGNRGRLDHRF